MGHIHKFIQGKLSHVWVIAKSPRPALEISNGNTSAATGDPLPELAAESLVIGLAEHSEDALAFLAKPSREGHARLHVQHVHIKVAEA